MKRTYAIATVTAFAALSLFVACGAGNDTTTDADTATDATPDADTAVPTKPEDDFFEHTTENWLELTFKGLINKAEDFDTGNITDGIGEFIFEIGGETLDVSDDPAAFLAQLPDDYPYEEYRGLEYIGLIAMHILEQGTTEGHLYYFSAGIAREFLQELKTAETPEAVPPTAFWATLYDYSYFIRADQVTLLKFCPITKYEAAANASALFVDARANKSFAPGENLIIWGNIAITAESEGEMCRYMMGDADITKEQYDEEKAKNVLDFSCELPENFAEPRYEEYDMFRSRGIINDAESADITTSAAIERTVLVNGKELEVLSYQSAWYLVSWAGTDYIALQSLGNFSSAAETYHFTSGELYLMRDTLAALKESGETLVGNVASQIYLVFSEVDEKVDGNDYLMKQCPVAVLDVTVDDHSLFFCSAGNTDFAVGEYIEAAGNMALTHDPAAIAEYVQYEGCVCYRYPDGGDAVAMDCADFEE